MTMQRQTVVSVVHAAAVTKMLVAAAAADADDAVAVGAPTQVRLVDDWPGDAEKKTERYQA